MVSIIAREFFREQGYFAAPRLLSPELLSRLVSVTEKQFAAANDPARRTPWDIMEPGDTAVYRLSRMIDRDPVFRAVAMHPRAVEFIQAVLGDDAELCINRHNMLIAKAPHVGSEFPWHQDGYGWGSCSMMTLMVLMDQATTENGCLQIIPGLHRNGFFSARPPGEFSWAMNSDDPDVAEVIRQSVPMEGKPGDGLFFHSMTPHRSSPNTSTRSRRSLSFAYVSRKDKWLRHPAKDDIESIALEPFSLT